MRIMTVNNLSIICEQTKKAKYCTFEKGINVVTSDSIKSEGNFVGKSSLLRSIFHTLGADARFSDMWEKKGNIFISLNFVLTMYIIQCFVLIHCLSCLIKTINYYLWFQIETS